MKRKKLSPCWQHLAKKPRAPVSTSKLVPTETQCFFLPCKQGGNLFTPHSLMWFIATILKVLLVITRLFLFFKWKAEVNVLSRRGRAWMKRKKLSPCWQHLVKNKNPFACTSKLIHSKGYSFFLPCKQGGNLFPPHSLMWFIATILKVLLAITRLSFFALQMKSGGKCALTPRASLNKLRF